jgi:3-deoxy-manno-octulosonate cytidylyltransferase (CMP-KDO synthetase)
MVATDHLEIEGLVNQLGYQSVMTDPELASGSDRVWAAAKDIDVDIIVNIQGDEPLLTGALLDQLLSAFDDNPELEMATLGRSLKDGDLESLQTAKITLDEAGHALYFSRYPIPYSRKKVSEVGDCCLKHIGLYAYRKSFLQKFCEKGPVQLELAEGLEQLRALYLGARIKVVKVEHESWGVDTPEDIAIVEKVLGEKYG